MGEQKQAIPRRTQLPQSGSAPFTATATSSSPLQFGRAGTSHYYGGSLDELALYPTALTPAQIEDHYTRATNPPAPTTLRFAHDDNSNQTLAGGRSYSWNLGGQLVGSTLGQYLDPVTGLYNLRARQYDPTVGRFLSIDPVEHPTEEPFIAAYVYAGNRPTLMIDPSGETLRPADAGRMAAAAAASPVELSGPVLAASRKPKPKPHPWIELAEKVVEVITHQPDARPRQISRDDARELVKLWSYPEVRLWSRATELARSMKGTLYLEWVRRGWWF